MKWGVGMKKRLMCLALVFVLTFSAAMRPRQEAYAFAATATVATVALALIAACGVTFVSGNSHSISATVDDFLEKNAGVKSFIENLISNFGAGGKILLTEIHLYPWVKEGFSNLISAVRSYFSGDAGEGLGGGSVSIEAPSAAGWNISTDVVSETFGPFEDGTFFRSPFFISISLRHSISSDSASISVFFLCLNDGALYISSNGFSAHSERLASLKLGAVDAEISEKGSGDISLKKFEALLTDDWGLFVSSPSPSTPTNAPCTFFADRSSSLKLYTFGAHVGPSVTLTSGGRVRNRFCTLLDGESYGDISLLQYVDWDAFLSSFPFVPLGGSSTAASDFVYAYPADVTPDLLAQKWADALDAEGADLVINPVDAGELVGVAGYDVAYGTDTAAGAIVGVDLPAVPAEVPDTPVIPGEDTDHAGILSKLGSILSGIKALPGQIAGTVIGTGELDWSALQGVSFKTVFPFCIPFDLADALTSLRASPKEPLWEVDFSGTAFAPAGAVVIDLRTFSRLFAIIRFFVYGGFVVSLIVLTRKLIKG